MICYIGHNLVVNYFEILLKLLYEHEKAIITNVKDRVVTYHFDGIVDKRETMKSNSSTSNMYEISS